jgi:hypothetical protein
LGNSGRSGEDLYFYIYALLPAAFLATGYCPLRRGLGNLSLFTADLPLTGWATLFFRQLSSASNSWPRLAPISLSLFTQSTLATIHKI